MTFLVPSLVAAGLVLQWLSTLLVRCVMVGRMHFPTYERLYGDSGEYTLAFFPLQRVYGRVWALLGVVQAVLVAIRFAAEETWMDEAERAHMADIEEWELVLAASLFLTPLWAPLSTLVALEGALGKAAAVGAALTVGLSASLAVVGLAGTGSFLEFSWARYVFGELTWGLYTGWLVAATVLSVGVAVVRCHREPDPPGNVSVFVMGRERSSTRTTMASVKTTTQEDRLREVHKLPNGRTNAAVDAEPWVGLGCTCAGVAVAAIAAPSVLAPILPLIALSGRHPVSSGGRRCVVAALLVCTMVGALIRALVQWMSAEGWPI